ncbi:hypothetical protein DPMN_049044 [Dreissena polymorpha]|uniref:Uncharacterized protein n=1 Tax=Dreissena polymorpha TaxID=45954 RepID=A0A9D4DBY5_DREPO|nr:hypothetical protein DPMN_049044 [Dreissena polymorpha]
MKSILTENQAAQSSGSSTQLNTQRLSLRHHRGHYGTETILYVYIVITLSTMAQANNTTYSISVIIRGGRNKAYEHRHEKTALNCCARVRQLEVSIDCKQLALTVSSWHIIDVGSQQ